MAVASPRLFLALGLFLSPSPSHRLCVSPCLSSPLYSPIVLIVLFVLPLALNPSHTQLLPTYMPTHVYTYTHPHTCICTHIHVRSASLDVFARSVYHPSILPHPPFHRSVPSSLLFVPLTGYHIRVSRSENSSVGPG